MNGNLNSFPVLKPFALSVSKGERLSLNTFTLTHLPDQRVPHPIEPDPSSSDIPLPCKIRGAQSCGQVIALYPNYLRGHLPLMGVLREMFFTE